MERIEIYAKIKSTKPVEHRTVLKTLEKLGEVTERIVEFKRENTAKGDDIDVR